MKPLVYVAGPYSSPDPVMNTRSAIRYGVKLISDGAVTPIIPHLTMLADLVEPMLYESWLEYDLDVLAHCDAVLRIPGASSGADGEVVYAREHNMPVFTDVDELYKWAERR